MAVRLPAAAVAQSGFRCAMADVGTLGRMDAVATCLSTCDRGPGPAGRLLFSNNYLHLYK